MTTIAITGANGYIGSFLCRFLKEKGYAIYKMGRNLKEDKGYKLIPYTLDKKQTVPLQNIDILIHCAYDFSMTNYEKSRAVNVDGSLYLFEEAKRDGVKKIIYLSSVSSFEETKSNYGKIKYEIEQKAKVWDVVTVRPGLVFSEQPQSIVGALDKLAASLPVLPIIGRGDQVFFPCHVEDLAGLIAYLCEHDVDTGKPIVAACQESITFKEILIRLSTRHHKSPFLLPLPYGLLYTVLKCVEAMRLPLGLRSDSLKYMKYAKLQLDFEIINKMPVNFRSFLP